MEFADILSNFRINGKFVSCEPYGSGLINRTYVAVFDENGKRVRYIVQRINSKLFTNVDGLMNNIKLVTEFNREEIRKRGGNPDRESLTLVYAVDGKPYFKAAEDEYYRVYVFIEDAKGYDVVEKSEHFYESAVAFGKFAMLLDRFDSSKLFEVLPDFHNTVKRFANFKKSLEKDAFGRAKDVRPEIEFALKHEGITNKIVDLLKSGDMPSRVTHNDTKLNNVLIDTRTDKAVCVIDLDTMMPGSICYDFGECKVRLQPLSRRYPRNREGCFQYAFVRNVYGRIFKRIRQNDNGRRARASSYGRGSDDVRVRNKIFNRLSGRRRLFPSHARKAERRQNENAVQACFRYGIENRRDA